MLGYNRNSKFLLDHDIILIYKIIIMLQHNFNLWNYYYVAIQFINKSHNSYLDNFFTLDKISFVIKK